MEGWHSDTIRLRSLTMAGWQDYYTYVTMVILVAVLLAVVTAMEGSSALLFALSNSEKMKLDCCSKQKRLGSRQV